LSSSIFNNIGSYKLKVTASKPGFITRITTILLELKLKEESSLTAKNDELDIYREANITLEVYYESVYQIPHLGIAGANVTFSVIDFPAINGSLISNGTIGWYKCNLNSSIFINIENYELKVTASKLGYVTRTTTILLELKFKESNLAAKKGELDVLWEAN